MYVLNAKIFEHKNDILIPICVSTDYVLIKSLHDKLTHYFNEHTDSGSDERLEYILSAKDEKKNLLNAIRETIPDFRADFVMDSIIKNAKAHRLLIDIEMWEITETALI